MNEEVEKVSVYASKAIEWLVEFLPKMGLAILILVIGFWLIKKINTVIRMSLEKAGISQDVAPFLASLLDGLMKIMVLFFVAGTVGIDTTSIVAVLGAAVFAIGMALQGSLGNFAAGIFILVFKPYRVGDWIEAADKFGKVKEVQIFNTIMTTPGKKTIIIPNGQITEGVVTNLSTEDHFRIELEVTMPYSEDFNKVEAIIKEVLKTVPGVLQDPEPEVGIETYDTHFLIVAVRPFIHPDDYWKVKFESNRRIKAAFSEHKIKVAYSEGVELGEIGG